MKDVALRNFIKNFTVRIPLTLKKIIKDISKDENLNLQEHHILSIIKDKPDCSMTDLSKRLSMPKSNLTVFVNNAVKKNLIERVFDENDRRLILLKLTDNGLRELKIQDDIIRKLLQEKFKDFTEDDINKLNKHAKEILDILKKYI